eukprot:TRINITY_DN2506_c0_g1_i1.p1 TRINITY_DN2506_c0_g1~~TRINITY_DN2506_c0_g1_i1.p1  ORF type:complete len:600 (-),score=139.16 TRINITY_DN2506_c0_g1_i1:182-1981(-)
MKEMSDCSEQVKQHQSERGLSIPADFRCPLSLELMSDPVIVASGQTYERAYIQHWLDQGMTTCPKTGQTLGHSHLIPNYTVKALIASWCEAKHLPVPQSTPPPVCSLEKFESLQGIKQSNSNGCSDLASGKVSNNNPIENNSESLSGSGQISFANEVSKKKLMNLVSEISEVQGFSGALSEATSINEAVSPRHVLKNTDVHETLGGHSRTTSHSSFASSLDDGQVSTAEVTNASWSSDISGELTTNPSGAASCHGEIQTLTRSFERFRSADPIIWRQRSSDTKYMSSMLFTRVESSINNSSSDVRIEALIADLESGIIELQSPAAAELRLLARNNPKDRITIASCGAIKPLVSLLHSPDLKTQEHAVTALLNLSINDNNKTEIVAAGAIEPLIHVLKTGNSEGRENAAAALFSLSVNDETKIMIGRSGAIPPLVNLLRNGTLRGKKDAATALFKLSISHENKARIVRAGAVRFLVELMDPAAAMVDKSVAIIWNLSSIPEGRQSISEEGGISALVEVLEQGSQNGKENAAAALLQLCVNSSKFRSVVLQEGAIPPLVALSQSGTPRGKEKAQLLLRHFRDQRRSASTRQSPDTHTIRYF